MSCFDVVYHQSMHHPGYLAHQRTVPNSPLKKRCRLDPDLQETDGGKSYPAAAIDGGLYYDRGLPFPGTASDALKPDPLTPPGAAATSSLSGQTISRSSALTSPSKSSSSMTSPSTSSSSLSSSSRAAAAASSSSTSSSTSSVVVALKCELMTSSSNDDGGDDEGALQQPVMTQSIGGNGVLLTYFSEDIDTNIDNHFHRALQLAQQHGAHRAIGRFGSASSTGGGSVIAENKSHASSCCRQESSPLFSKRCSFPSSFWNTVSCTSSNAASSSNASSSSACPSSTSPSASSYHPSNGSSWSSLMVSPSKADPLAAAFTVSPNPADPYHHHLNAAHFASAAASPPGPLHQDPWNPYASFCPPPPPPSQSSYRRYRHSIHEFSFSSDSPCSSGSPYGSGVRYKSLLNGSDDPKCHAAAAADVWRSRCYGCADLTSSHLAAGFTLTGDIEVTQTNLPDASVKDVYWF